MAILDSVYSKNVSSSFTSSEYFLWIWFKFVLWFPEYLNRHTQRHTHPNSTVCFLRLTCSSSCWTTCIWTLHWAVLLSSRECSLLRCLQKASRCRKGKCSLSHKSELNVCKFFLCVQYYSGWSVGCQTTRTMPNSTQTSRAAAVSAIKHLDKQSKLHWVVSTLFLAKSIS